MITKDQPTIFDTASLVAYVSSKHDGDVKSNNADDAKTVIDNIQAFSRQAGIPYDQIVAMNVGAHGDIWDEIADVASAPNRALVTIEDRVIADALVTTRKDVVLMLPVADCNAVAIHDPVNGVLALVHLGWQSTAADLAGKMVAYLQQNHQSKPRDLRVYNSPSIRLRSYIFDEVSQADDPSWQPFLHTTDQGIGIDLPGYNKQRFIDMGIPAEAIEICPVNTATSDDYFSHYRAVRVGEPDGRFALFAKLV